MGSHPHTSCRNCRLRLPPPFLSLGDQPPANALLDYPEQIVPYYPLNLVRCVRCGMVQLDTVVDKEELFRRYLYTPSQSRTFHEHFHNLAAEAVHRFCGSGAKVLDIGSNDGLLLGFFQDRGCLVQGVDPAAEIAALATEHGIPTMATFFDRGVATVLDGPFDIVTATNVVAHVDQLGEFLEGVRIALAQNGVFIVEVPYLPDMLESGTFDLIYSEHLSYWLLTTLSQVLAQHSLQVFDAQRVPIHGGSLRVFSRQLRATWHLSPLPSVADILAQEVDYGYLKPDAYFEFAQKAERVRRDFLSVLSSSQAPTAGYGAPAKATVLLNYCDLGPNDIAFIVDDNPLKQGKYVPGARIPIVDKGALDDHHVERVVAFAWNVLSDILPKLGGRYEVVVPLPELRVIPRLKSGGGGFGGEEEKEVDPRSH